MIKTEFKMLPLDVDDEFNPVRTIQVKIWPEVIQDLVTLGQLTHQQVTDHIVDKFREFLIKQ